MKVLDVRVGQAVQLGDQAVVKVAEKTNGRGGQKVRLVFATHLAIELIATGIIPARFSTGLTGERMAHRPPTGQMAEPA